MDRHRFVRTHRRHLEVDFRDPMRASRQELSLDYGYVARVIDRILAEQMLRIGVAAVVQPPNDRIDDRLELHPVVHAALHPAHSLSELHSAGKGVESRHGE